MSDIINFGRAFDCDSLAGFGTLIFVGNAILRGIEDSTRFLANVEVLSNGFIIASINDAVDALDVSIDDLQAVVLDSQAAQTAVITAAVSGSTTKIESAITVASADSAVVAETTTAKVIDILTGLVINESSKTNQRVDAVAGPILAAVDGVTTATQLLDGNISSQFSGVNSVLDSILGTLGDGIDVVINNQVVLQAGIFDALLSQVGALLNGDIARINSVLDNVLAVFQNVFDSAVGVFEAVLTREQPELIAIKDAILHNKDENTAILEALADPEGDGLGGIIARSVFARMEPDLDLSADELRQGFVDFFQGPSGFECINDQAMRDVMEGRPLTGFLGYVIEGLTWLAAAGPLISGLASAKAQPSIQDYMLCNPTFPLPIAESIIALQRGLIDPADVQDNIQRTGLGAEDAERLVNIGFTVPDLAIIYNMFYRDLIDDDAFDQLLRDSGYTQGLLDPLKVLAFFVPPVQDLITMAVREVFSPEIAEAQGQFEDFPPDFERFAKQQGVSAEWAKNYWAAHWSLPSVQMGFEMLHRGVIDRDTMEFLLRALDVMPVWRSRLIDISFSPFTRVDIRRMNKLGILDEAEVNTAYHEIGYDDDKAEKLTAFTLALNADDPIVTFDIAEDLTRGSIVNFYKDGIISRTASLALLIQAGINVAAAELFLDSADFDLERAERKADVNIVLDRFRVGALNESEASDLMRTLDLESRELELALLDLERLAAREIKSPSRAELDKFVKERIITTDEYILQMERLGWSRPWPERFLTAATN